VTQMQNYFAIDFCSAKQQHTLW